MTVYRCTPAGGIELLQCYIDEDAEEAYFACTWTVDEASGAALLLFAGRNAVVRPASFSSSPCLQLCPPTGPGLGPDSDPWLQIRVVDSNRQAETRALVGHGASINDLKIHPRHPALLLSASQDESIRLWNLATGVCALIFGGEGGHRNEVLSCDWHRTEPCTMVSSGMDCIIKVRPAPARWRLVAPAVPPGSCPSCLPRGLCWVPLPQVWEADGPYLETMQAALGPWDRPVGMFPTRHVQMPRFSTYRVHSNYVDCVRWYNDCLLSKSVDSVVVFWQPEADPSRKGEVRLLRQLPLREADLWFIRFGLDGPLRTLACGNRTGQVRIWDTSVAPPVPLGHFRTQAAKPVRQCSPNLDGSIVLCCCEDGSVYRWDEKTGGERKAAIDARRAENLQPCLCDSEASDSEDDGGGLLSVPEKANAGGGAALAALDAATAATTGVTAVAVVVGGSSKRPRLLA